VAQVTDSAAARDLPGVNPAETEASRRLAHIEGLLEQVLRELRGKRRRGTKRGRTVAQRQAAAVTYTPTELQMAAARRALRRHR
jgi:hypothetical protein